MSDAVVGALGSGALGTVDDRGRADNAMAGSPSTRTTAPSTSTRARRSMRATSPTVSGSGDRFSTSTATTPFGDAATP